MTTNSCLYECRVLHHRYTPRDHRFVYRVFYCCFDLDELPELGRKLWLFSLERFNLLSFRDRDFLPVDEPLHAQDAEPRSAVPSPAASLKQRVLGFAKSHGAEVGPDTRVRLIALPRVLGYLFNPASFYFLTGPDDRPLGAIVEVTNTFHEVKPYWIPAAGDGPTAFRRRTPKHFYVSPFSPLDLTFDFDLRPPGEHLALRIDDRDGERLVLHSLVTGTRAPLTDGRLAGFLLKYPLVTVKIITLIHWQAFRLWRRGVPFFRKAEGSADQRDLYRPHPSIARPAAS